MAVIEPPDPPPEPLPAPQERRRVNRVERPIALVAVLGGGIALIAVVAGLVYLGAQDSADDANFEHGAGVYRGDVGRRIRGVARPQHEWRRG